MSPRVEMSPVPASIGGAPPVNASRRTPFSLQLSRSFMIVAWLGLVLGDGASLFRGTSLILASTMIQSVTVATLFILPTISAAAAAVAMVSASFSAPSIRAQSKFGRYLQDLWEPHLRLQLSLSRLDMTWHVTGVATLLVYVSALVVGCISPVDLPQGSYGVLSGNDVLLGYSMEAVAIVATLMCLGSRFTYTVLLYPLMVLYLVRFDGAITWDAFIEPTFLLTFNLTLVASLTILYNRAGYLDDAVDALEVQARNTVSAHAEQLAKRRAESYVHDHILSALGPAAMSAAGHQHIRSAAQAALRSLESVPARFRSVTAAQLFEEIEGVAKARCPSIETDVIVGERTELTQIGPEVARALVGAATEAVSNSVTHASRGRGGDVIRTVQMIEEDGRIDIVVKDNGSCSDTQLISESIQQRHGVRSSIIGRMRDVGGHASTDFELGRGFKVQLSWEKPRVPERTRALLLVDEDILSSTLQTRTARALAVWAVVGTILMMWGCADEYSTLVGPAIALVLQACAAVALMWPGQAAEQLKWTQWFTIASVALGNLLVLGALTAPDDPGFGAWSVGSGWLLCVLLLLGRGPVAAWLAMLAMGLSTFVWAAASHQGSAVAARMIIGQLVGLMIWTGVAWWSRRLMISVSQTELAIRESEAQQLAAETSLAFLEARLHRLSGKVRPVLEQLSRKQHASPELKLEASVLEGELRDEIRASSLLDERLVAAAREARRRGVEVVLLDDRGPESPLDGELYDMICGQAVESLRQTDSGRVVIRLLPDGRDKVASIVAPSGALMISASVAV